MKYTSKIENINKVDSFINKDGKTMNKYVVTFANGHSPHIYSVGDFKQQVGDEVSYDLDQAKNKAKIEKMNTPNSGGQNANNTNRDQIIVRQTVIKAAAEFHANSNSTANDVVQTAQYFLNWINNE